LGFVLTWIGALNAQDNDIRFALEPVEAANLPENVTAQAELRIKQGLSRSNALSENTYEVFAVQPSIAVEDALETEGMIREVAVVKAELTLTAVNSIDGTIYHTAVIPLKASATDGKAKALEKMALGIKATDAVFVRFVRQARQKVLDFYSNNCSKILAVAKNLADTGRGEDALAYLKGVSPSVDCYDLASAMIKEIAESLPRPAAEPEPEPEPEPVKIIEKTDTVYIDRIVEVPVEITPEPTKELPQPVPAQPQPEIILGSNDMTFKIISCYGDKTTKKIYIQAEFVNLNRDKEEPYCRTISAFDNNGSELTELGVKFSNDSWYRHGYIKTPYKIPVKMNYSIGGFDDCIQMLSYVELSIRSVKVVIKNLPVKW